MGTSGDIATVSGNGAATASFSAPTTGTAASTLTFQVGSNAAVTATYGTDFTSGSTLATYLTAQLGSQATVTDGGGSLSVTSNIVGTNVATVGGTGAAGASFSAPTTSAAGSSLVLTDQGGQNSTSTTSTAPTLRSQALKPTDVHDPRRVRGRDQQRRLHQQHFGNHGKPVNGGAHGSWRTIPEPPARSPLAATSARRRVSTPPPTTTTTTARWRPPSAPTRP